MLALYPQVAQKNAKSTTNYVNIKGSKYAWSQTGQFYTIDFTSAKAVAYKCSDLYIG